MNKSILLILGTVLSSLTAIAQDEFDYISDANGARVQTTSNVKIGTSENRVESFHYVGTEFLISSKFGTSGNASQSWIPYQDGEVYITSNKDQTTGTGDIHLRTYSTSESYKDRLTIKGSGNIGIGTNDPQANLHIKTTDDANQVAKIKIWGTGSTSNIGLGGTFKSGNADAATFGNYNVAIESWQGIGFISDSNGKKGIIFNTRTASAFFEGSVGIGTDLTNSGVTEDYKLYVTEGIRTEKVKVDVAAGSWADYVFEEDYKPASLQEVENYIKENKHLPDIPSAKEVETEGLNLGEMDAKLLQKVEELTLYMIEQDKLNKEQQKAIEELKAENIELKKLLDK